MGRGLLVAAMMVGLIGAPKVADACSPPQPRDAGPEVPMLFRSVEPTGGIVPTNVAVRVHYAHKYFPFRPNPNITARIAGGGPLSVTVEHVESYLPGYPYEESVSGWQELYEVRVAGVPPDTSFELLDQFDAPCSPCTEREPAPFASFTAGAGPDVTPPILDPHGGQLIGTGYAEQGNS